MKRVFIALTTICLLFAGTAFAQEAEAAVESEAVINESSTESPSVQAAESSAYEATEAAIKKNGLFFKKDTVFENSMTLTLDEKNELYDKYKKNPTLVGLLNGLVGFGVGSWVQKEFLPAAGFMTTEIIGWTIGIMGYFAIQDIANSSAESESAAGAIVGGLAGAFAGAIVGVAVIGVGGIIVIASRLVSAGVCVGITNGYNAKLRTALGLNEQQEITLLPIIDPYENKAGLMVSLKL